jgi:hypothetical protein
LARAKASGAADANTAIGIRGGGVCNGIYIRIVPDDDPNIRWGFGFDHIGDGPQLALLQSPPAQLVGPKRGREASKASASREFQEETRQEVG